MIEDKKILAIIPAKKNSRRLPGKNMKKLSGKPLLLYTIEAAKKSKLIDSILCSTDDEKILSFSKTHGCHFAVLRHKSITKDNTVVLDVVKKLKKFTNEYDYIVILQPTSPLRNADDIDNTIKFCVMKKASYATTISKFEINPFCILKKKNNTLTPVLEKNKRLTKEQLYILNGAVYVIKKDLLNTKGSFKFNPVYIELPPDRSIDIDTPEDFNYARVLLSKNKK
tara:strand:- start:60 stop:734 length:675 start_codon:yes stop_codon:yes gene_type:complete